MIRLVLGAVAILVTAGSISAAGAETAAPMVVDFERADLGRAPSGFTIARTGHGEAPVWVVQEDPTAPSGKRVLVQTSTDTTGSRFPLCVYDAVSAADVILSVKFKPISGTVDQAAGLVWRYQNPDNYYLVRANALESNVVLFKVEGGKRSNLKPLGAGLLSYSKKATVEAGSWQSLEVRAVASRFSVFLNGEPLFEVEDTTFRAPGKVGLWTKADSVTAFDDLVVTPRP
jgi:hypothetical protein